MTFTDTDKLKALAIVNVFETSLPFGDYAACALLNDGAGISYGINQFTHRSGSLLEVAVRYLKNGGRIGRGVIEESLPLLKSNSRRSIRSLAVNQRFVMALKAAARTREMRFAQNEIASEKYLLPAIEACENSRFTLPLTLAVIYDSINHGSWDKIRDRVKVADSNEKAWIRQYVGQRAAWLKSIPRLRATSYRTDFFLKQIAQGNWNLDLPLNVHGVMLKNYFFRNASVDIVAADRNSAVEHPKNSAVSSENLSNPSTIDRRYQPVVPTNAQPPIIQAKEARHDPNVASLETTRREDYLDAVQQTVNDAAAKYDQAEAIVQTVITRTDAAKSLWTAIVGTIWQSIWAVGSFVIGLPNEVWLVVALIVAALMLLYLNRQVALGKIRERSAFTLQRAAADKKQAKA